MSGGILLTGNGPQLGDVNDIVFIIRLLTATGLWLLAVC